MEQRNKIAAVSGVVAAGFLLMVGCSQDVTPPEASLSAAPSSRSVAAQESALARFHRTNRLDYAGAAHNRALAKYMLRLEHREVRGDLCLDILNFSTDPSNVPGGELVSRRALRSHAAYALSYSGLCGTTKRASIFRHARFQESGGGGSVIGFDDLPPSGDSGLSDPAVWLLTDMDLAVRTATSAEDLAAKLQVSVDASVNLSSVEADLIAASASIAVASWEYWEATLTDDFWDAQTRSMYYSYEGCMTPYPDAESAVAACVGLHAPTSVLPAAGRGVASSPYLRFVTKPAPCPSASFSEFAYTDFVSGAAAGATAIPTGVGIVPAAVAGAVGGSAGDAAWQTAKGAYCWAKWAFDAGTGRPRQT